MTILTQSCSNTDADTNQKEVLKFDYSVYYQLIEANDDFSNSISKAQHYSLAQKKAILDTINNFYGTDVSFPDLLLNLTDSTSVKIKQISLSNNWVTLGEASIYDTFVSDLNDNTFRDAMDNFENTILANNPSPEDFEKYNSFANTIKYINHQNPEYFDLYQTRGWWACAFATAAFVGSSVSAGLACVPEPAAPLTCPLAVTMASYSYANMIYQCVTAAKE